MMRGLFTFARLQLVAFALLLMCACRVVPPPPTPTVTSSPSPSATPTLTPSPSPTPTLTPLPPFVPWPTTTPYEPEAERGLFFDPDYGVTVRYPRGWSLDTDTDSASLLAWFINPDWNVFVVLFVSPASPSQTLEEVASQIGDANLSFLDQMTVLEDGMITLDDGREAWHILATGALDDGTVFKISLTAAIRGGRAYTLMAYGTPESYDDYRDDLDNLVRTMHLELPLVHGIPRDQVLVLLGGESTNPREYDPATTHSGSGDLVFGGLVSFGPQLNLVPDLAESWQVQDGVVYTFRLHADASFHDGRPVTAYDVVYSWERAADPETESDTVLTYLGDIVGVREMREGEADHISGLRVIDEHTLQVTIDAPKPYFLFKLTYPTAFVVDQANVESGPDWYRTPNGTGPYRLARWDRFELMLFERNERYHLEPPAIPYIAMKLYSGVGMRMYEMGDIDITGVGYWDVPRVTDPDDPLSAELQQGVNMCTGYIVFDVDQPPFDDPKVRQAFSMAFDRQQYIDVVLEGIALPARGIYPPGLPGYDPDLEGLPYDPQRARQLLAESKYGGPEGLPPIVYTSSGIGNDAWGINAALAEMWQRNLGVTIVIENLESDRYQDEIDAGNHGQVFYGGWCADYPDPENFADVLFYTGSQENEGHYSNPELDALLEKARVEQDGEKRLQLYQQAEGIIVEDAPALFLTHSVSYVLVKPHIKGYMLTPIGVPIERYLWIDPGRLD